MIGGSPLESEYLASLPTETVDAHPVIGIGRERIVTAASALLDVEDAALERTWPWKGEALDVRYGFYDAYERLEIAGGAVMRALAEAGTAWRPGRGGRLRQRQLAGNCMRACCPSPTQSSIATRRR